MKVLVPNHEYDYPEDIKRIQEAFALFDYEISAVSAEYAWLQYSDEMSAGWIMLPESRASILNCARQYLRIKEE